MTKQLTSAGRPDLARRVAALMVRIRPSDVRVALLAARIGIWAQSDGEELADHGKRLVPFLDGESFNHSVEQILLDLLLQLAELDMTADLDEVLAGVVELIETSDDGDSLPWFDRLARGLSRRGNAEAARTIVDALGNPTFDQPSVYRLALDLDFSDLAPDRTEGIDQLPGRIQERWGNVEADRAIKTQDPFTALQIIDSMKPVATAAQSHLRIQAWKELGRWDLVQDYLDSFHHMLSSRHEALFRFDAAWDRGDLDGAEVALADEIVDTPINLDVLQRLAKLDTLRHGTPAKVVEYVRSVEDLNTPENLIAAYAALDRPDEVIRMAETTKFDRLQPGSVVHYARALYTGRDFDGALAALDTLRGRRWRWDADKLRARIWLELGEFDRSIAARSRVPATDDHDEVLYHALLHTGRYDEAFGMYLPRSINQAMTTVFGDEKRWDPPQPLDDVFVIAYGGPGDEIMLAATYAQLAADSRTVQATCDPRLHSLLSRSFPSIEFFPVERLTPGSFDLAARRAGRPDNPLYFLLDDRAYAAAANASTVIAGRELARLMPKIRQGPTVTSYLVQPTPDKTTEPTRRVGLVWRSEINSPIRSIHYLTPADLAPLASIDATIVNLQHDATPDELGEITAALGQPLQTLAELDLRNDFDGAADALSSLDLVIGIGTTTVELAGALGVPTIMIQPTHFGTWRSQTGHDFWHPSMVQPAVDQPWKRAELVTAASALAASMPSGVGDVVRADTHN